MTRAMRRRLISGLLIVSSLVALATRMMFQSPSNQPRHPFEIASTLAHIDSVSSGHMQHPVLTELLKSYNCSTDESPRHISRRRRMDDSCPQDTRIKPIVPSDFRYMFVDDLHKVIYCAVPKVACTNWKRVMLMLTGKMNVTRLEALSSYDVHHKLQDNHLRLMSQLSADEIRTRLDSYFKFLFVRHPLERIVSAYENKFATPRYSYFQTRYGRRIIRQYRWRASNESLARGHDVTFNEFVRYLGDHWLSKDDRPLNAHWRPYSELCLPCQVRYDVIGKYETMTEDAAYVLDVITKTTVANDSDSLATVTFPAGPRRANRTHDVLSRFSGLSARHFRLVAELYADDLKLFGYEYRLRANGSLAGYQTATSLPTCNEHSMSIDDRTSNTLLS